MRTDVQEEVAEGVEEESSYTKLEQQHYADINVKAKEVAALAAKADVAKEKAKIAKGNYDAAACELQELILRGPNPQPLLPGMDDDGHQTGGQDASWRSLIIAELGLSDAVTTYLIDHGIDSLGKLSDAMNREQWWKDIAGIGEGKAEKIGEAFAGFWANHPEFCQTDDRPKRCRILEDIEDIEDGDLQAGDEFDISGWSEGQPVIVKDDRELYLQAGDWAPCD